MRVLHVGLEAPGTRDGGLNRYLAALLAEQRGAGLDATAVVLGGDLSAPAGMTLAGPASGPWMLRAVRVDTAVRRLRASRGFDVADLHFAGTSVFTATLGALRRVPKVVHFQGPWADESASAGSRRANVAAKRAAERAVYRRAARFVVLSSAFGRILEERYGVAPWLVRVLSPGVDLERFTPGDRAAARSSLAAPPGRVVLAVRRLVPRMGLDVLLDAWRQLAPTSEDLLVLVGTGPEDQALRERAATLGIDGVVRFAGRVEDDELVEWYRAADATAVPSVELEGFGLVVLESLACGTPVVGTDAAGLREAVTALGQGPAVRAGDPVALAEGLRGVLDASRSDERADPAACRRAAERHGWSHVERRHRAVYDEVLNATAPLRVAVLDHTAVLSGGELALARALEGVRATVAVHVILGADGPLRDRLTSAGASVEVLSLDERARGVRRGEVRLGGVRPKAVLSSARHVIALARRLRRLHPDVVHANSLKSALYGGAAARLARVPCVWHVRDRIEGPELPPAAVSLVRLAARVLPTVVVANSRSTLRTVGVPGVVVPSPLDPSIEPGRPRHARPGPLRVAVVGRLAEWKGQHLAIEAFAAAFPQGSETLRVIGAPLFGEHDYAASLAPLADSLGVGERVSFDGFVDDVASALELADVVVHSSVLPEPFGQVVLEAMGSGCAVVVANAGGPAELVEDEVDGLHYAMGDRDALASALRRLAGDPALRSALGAAAQHKAATYTPAALAPLLIGAWRDALDKGGVRRGRR